MSIGVFNANIELHHCDGFYVNSNDGNGDYYARLVYHLGTLTPSQSKTVKFVYRRK